MAALELAEAENVMVVGVNIGLARPSSSALVHELPTPGKSAAPLFT